MDPFRSLCILTGPYLLLLVFMRPEVFLWVLMLFVGPYVSLLVLIRALRSLWVFKGPYASL